MADYGLVAYNTAGTVQIDQNYFNLAMVQKGTLNFGPSNNANFVIASLTYSGTSPLPAFVGGMPIGLKTLRQESNGSWTIEFVAAAAYNGAAFTYYIFDRPGGNTANYGLQVFDGAGKKTFDSGYKYMKFLATQNMDGHNNTGQTASVTGLPGGRTYACIISRGAFAYFSYFMGNSPTGQQQWDNYIYIQAANPTADGMLMSQFVVREFITTGASQGSTTMIGTAMVIDVTGY